jgi:outer membrane receptor protein involved in Fe transport
LQGREIFFVISPRAALSFPVHEKISLFADYGKGFRMPEARSILYDGEDTSDEDLKQYKGGTADPAVSHTVEAGAVITPVKLLSFKISGFGVWMEHEMVFDHVSNLNLEKDATTRAGAEIDAVFSFNDWLMINANTTYVHTRFNISNNPIPNVPAFMGTASVKAGREHGAHGGLDLFWMSRHNLAHGAVTSGYAKVSGDGGYRFKKFDITAIVENVLNAKIMEGTYHFASWFDQNEARSLIPEIQYVAGNPFTLRLVLTVFL